MNDPQPEGHMASYIRRRKFLAALGGAAVAWPVAARAQGPAKVPTIGFLGSGTPLTAGARGGAFPQGAREPGWIEDPPLKMHPRWAGGGKGPLTGTETGFGRQ